MPSTRRSRTIAAPPQEIWELLADPHHLPRWWPGVSRVEGVGEERWTEVHVTKRGRAIRLDFLLLASDPPYRRLWEQEVEGTPFERVLSQAVTEVLLVAPGNGSSGTVVTIELRQKLRGYSRTGGWLLRKSTRQRLDEALAGLARIFD